MLRLVERLKTQKGIVIEHQSIAGANHFYDDHMDDMLGVVGGYLDKRLAPAPEAEEEEAS